MKTYWAYGDRSKLARAANISASHLSEIIKGTNPCTSDLARVLEVESAKLGYTIPRNVWAFPEDRTGNPLFG